MLGDRYWGINPQMDEEGDENNKVVALDNRLYFYSEVTRPDCLTLNKALQTTGNNLGNFARNYGVDAPPIRLHINSYGGSVFAGLSSVDYIKDSPVPVHSIVEGCAASAATLMSVVADRRFIKSNAYMLIHQLSAGMWGKFEEMKDEMENCEALMESIKKIYAAHAKIPKAKLDEILKRDLWLDAKTCLEYGLVDEII